MQGKNKKLAIAMCIISAFSIVLSGSVVTELILDTFIEYFDLSNMDGFDTFFFVFMIICAFTMISFRVCSLAFIILSIRNNSRKFILTASILNIIFMDLTGIASGVLGFIIYHNLKKEQAIKNQNCIAVAESEIIDEQTNKTI